MKSFEENIKLATIKAEQGKYKNKLSAEELRKKTVENNKKNNYKELTDEEINQYIREVRNNGRE